MKKTTSLISMALALTLLAGCGSGTTGGKSSSAGEKPVESGTASKDAPKPELRMLGFQKNFNPNEDPVASFLEQKTGYKVKYEALPLENPDDKLNLLMANKEPYDILKLSATQYNRLATQGALEPLDDLLKKYGQTLIQVNQPEAFQNAKIDGKTYGIPEMHPKAFVGNALAIRQGLLDELGMKVPTTIDEFYDLLKAIKEKKGIIPLTGHQSEPFVWEISGAFGVTTQWDDSTGKLINRLESPGMKEYLTFMNKLYKEGLIDTEWPVNKIATVQEKFTSGKAGIMEIDWGMAPTVLAGLQKTYPDAKMTLIPALKGKDGKAQNWLQGGGVSWYIAIPKSSKNKEAAMQYLNMKVQPDVFKELAIGVENVDYKKDEQGKLTPILPKFTDDRNNADWFITSTDYKAFQEYWMVRVRKNAVVASTFDEIQKQVPISRKDPTLLAPPIDVVAQNIQKLNKMENDYVIKVLAGAESPDTLGNFVKQWQSQGGKDVYNALNDWYTKQK